MHAMHTVIHMLYCATFIYYNVMYLYMSHNNYRDNIATLSNCHDSYFSVTIVVAILARYRIYAVANFRDNTHIAPYLIFL